MEYEWVLDQIGWEAGRTVFSLSSPSFMDKKKEIVLSGIRPTGFVHLGNYLGAISNWVKMQEIFDCYYCIVDWHSLTTHPDTKGLKENVLRLLAELIGSGLDPEKCVLYLQSDVPKSLNSISI